MALVSKSGTPSLSTVMPQQSNVIGSGSRAGETISAGDACFIASTGLVWRCEGDVEAKAVAHGIAARDAASGEAVTLYRYVEFHYGSGLTPGAPLYLSDTAGALDTDPATIDNGPVAFAVDATRIFFHGNTVAPELGS